jgi:hypothetical protein
MGVALLMSFVPTGKVNEGQTVTHTTFQNIKQNIYDIYDMIGTDEVNMAAPYNPEHGPHALVTEGSFLSIFHTFKYLAFGSSGKIVDPSGIGSEVALSDPATGFGVYDLEGIGWLTYGMVYRVEGVTWAREVEVI